MNYSEIKSLIRTVQERNERENQTKFYTEHPEYLREQTLEQALNDPTISDLPEGEEPDWSELASGDYDGHTVELVEFFGGEGQGDSAWVVFRFDDTLYRKEGYYASYDGFYWDDYGSDFYEVESYTETVTKYRKVEK